MQFSIWDYLKERARKATLAGVAEALDELEGENSEASHEAAADRLRARLSGQAVKPLPRAENAATGQPVVLDVRPDRELGHTNGRVPDPGRVPEQPAIQGRSFGQGLEPGPAERPAPAERPVPAPAKAPDPFEARLNGALPKATPPPGAGPQDRRGPSRNGHGPALPEFDPPPRAAEPPAKPEAPERRKRGRPRKDG